jgi:hypothetical protein
MAGPITTGNHPKALWPGVKAWWGREYDSHGAEYKDLFEWRGSDKAYEETVEVTGFGLAPVKPEGASTTYDSETQGVVNRATHVAVSLGYIVTREELADSQYEVVSRRRAQANAFSMHTTKETLAANVYNRAFSGATFGDGVEILSTAHPTLSGNQSNELATAADLSEASLEDLLIQIMQAKNSRGHQIKLMPRCLIVPPSLHFEASRILSSTLQNDTANNAINVLRSSGALPEGVKVNHYLSDTDAFFIRTNCPEGMVAYQREGLEFSQDNDFDTDNAKAKSYERYSFTIGDWRGLYGSPGA